MAATRNFIDVLRAELAADPELAGLVEQEAVNADIAQQVHDLRVSARLSQKQLAELVGTSQSVISRIEDADYDGHSLSTLRRLAHAFGKKLFVKFCTEEQKRRLERTSTSSEAKISMSPVVTKGNVSIVYCTSMAQPPARVAGQVSVYVARNLQPALAE